MKHPNSQIEALLSTLADTKLATIDLSLNRVIALLKALGNPQEKLPPVVHIAGTNGKGSLLAYLAAIFKAAGYAAHCYTSPHLVRFNERIILAGKEIEDNYLLTLLERVAKEAKTHPVTFFEATTAVAFLAFSEIKADIVLLETGLGGRLDATNVIRAPAVTAITPISMDHMDYLGDTIAAIAGEKSGIIKQGVPCVIGPQTAEVVNIIERVANIKSVPLFASGKRWNAKNIGESFHYKSMKRDEYFPLPNLVGEHQIQNAATAIACLDCLKDFSFTHEHITEGITHAVWPARLQHLVTGSLARLLPEMSELWLDGGHNPAAGEVLAAWIKKQQKPVHLICGMLKNKDTKQFLLPLVPLVKSLTAVPIPAEPGGQEASIILDIAQGFGLKSCVSGDIKSGIEHIVKQNNNDYIILVCGSLYLAGNILWQNSQVI